MPQRCCAPIALCMFAVTACLAQNTSVIAPETTPNAFPVQALAPFPSGADLPVGPKIVSLLADPAVNHAHWGIAVTALDGTPLYGLDEAKSFRPASTAKLFTTAAAMALLGPDTRFTTGVYGPFDVSTGVVHGDLVLVGGGDPSFGANDDAAPDTPRVTNHDLQDLVEQLTAKGMHSITGKIVGNDELFENDGPPSGWAAEDLPWGYGSLPSALSYADNELRLTVKPHAAQSGTSAPDHAPSALLSLDQAVPYLQLANNVTTAMPAPGQHDRIDVQPTAGGPQHINVLGTVSPGAAAALERISLPDPALYTAEVLHSLLTQHGIQVTGSPEARHSDATSSAGFLAALRAPEDCAASTMQGVRCRVDCSHVAHSPQLLAQHVSAPLAADVRFTLKTSANLHAEILARQLDAKSMCAGISTVGGVRALCTWIGTVGLSDSEVVLYDGSGLSTKDLVTPRAEAHLLAYATAQPWFATWKAALPVGGVDGTLAGRFTHSVLKGKIFAKTGTLGESRALAGYVQGASGREVIVVILVDDHDPGSSADRTTMDALVELIAASF